MDAILYIQAAKEAHEDMKHQLDVEIAIQEVNKASFRPPHPSHASSAQQDWNDKNILSVNSSLPGEEQEDAISPI